MTQVLDVAGKRPWTLKKVSPQNWETESELLFATWRTRELKGTLHTRIQERARAVPGTLIIGVAGFGVLLAMLTESYRTAVFSLLVGLTACLYTVRQKPPSLLGAYDAPSALVQFAVKARFYAAHVPYATEIGVISFADGWLHYQSQATQFHPFEGRHKEPYLCPRVR